MEKGGHAVKSQTIHKILLYSYLPILVWSLISPLAYWIWFVEVSPVVVGGIILIVTYKRFRLTTLSYVLIWLASISMAIGGHYSYEHMPLFDWIRDEFGLQRNHYDRLGHFIKGLVLAMLAREILLRTTPLQKGGWLFVLVLSLCMGIAAGYEIVEFAATFVGSARAENEFLGMQGDQWDAQWDMLMATIGTLLAYWLFPRLQDHQMNAIYAEEMAQNLPPQLH